MSLSTILKQECPKCGKVAIEENRVKIFSSVMIKLSCGHIIPYDSGESTDEKLASIIFSDGCKPREYQFDAIRFGERAGFNFILADEQGLGKTIEVCSLFRLHAKKLLPAVVTVPTSAKIQWMREIHRICGDGPEFLTQVIQTGKEKAMPGFKIYIVTFDMLKKEDLFTYVPDIKTIVIDECQRIKNHLSDRAKAVQKIAKKCLYKIPMSGTPIKNNAGEYFTILNLVAPTRFPNYQRYLDVYCDSYFTGWSQKVGGLRDPKRFHDETKDIIIRRTKSDVLKDLPPKERKFYHVELNREVHKAYDAAMEELEELFYADIGGFERGAQTMKIMSKMRYIVGVSKVNECVEFLTEFLLSCDRKITVFCHHIDTARILEMRMADWCEEGDFAPPLHISSEMNGDRRQQAVDSFREGPSRILIASALSAGEALNLQFCSDAVMLERQWNPGNEEQAEDRFHRYGQQNNVSITYMIAAGTIDEYFTEIVERKRAIVASALDNKQIQWDEQSLMAELTQVLVAKGRRKWSL